MAETQTTKAYTAAVGAWKRFLWLILWGAVASGVAYLGSNLATLAGPLVQQAWWPVVVPLITAGLAALKKYADERCKGF